MQLSVVLSPTQPKQPGAPSGKRISASAAARPLKKAGLSQQPGAYLQARLETCSSASSGSSLADPSSSWNSSAGPRAGRSARSRGKQQHGKSSACDRKGTGVRRVTETPAHPQAAEGLTASLYLPAQLFLTASLHGQCPCIPSITNTSAPDSQFPLNARARSRAPC